MSRHDIPGFDAAQAAYENQHPDDGICPCHAEHENRECDGGYRLGSSGSYTCDHERCHAEDAFWPAKYYIDEGYIRDGIELMFVLGIIDYIENVTEELIDVALNALREAQQQARRKVESAFRFGFVSKILSIEEVTK